MSQDPMAEIRASFFIECEELLESLQDALAEMDNALGTGEQDSETINVVFRAVHSIKGGAGAFGLDDLVTFAHHYETVLDEVRSGQLEVTPEAMKLFFRAADQLQDHVRAARESEPPPATSDEILKELEALSVSEPEAEEATDFEPTVLSLDFGNSDQEDAPTAEDHSFNVKFRPSTKLFLSGNEPLMLLRALEKLGECKAVCDQSRLPDFADIQPEVSYLSWSVTISGDATEDEIRDVFDFVEDVCMVSIAHVVEAEIEPQAIVAESEEAQCYPSTPESVSPPPSSEPNSLTNGFLGRVEAQGAPRPPENEEQPVPQNSQKPSKPSVQPKKPTTRASGNDSVSATVRVDLDRIDRLVNLVGELVINQAMLAQSVSEAGLAANSAVATGLEDFMMLTRDIQDSVMMIRAQPVKPLFQRMARIVREASVAVNKEVRLITEGDATEVDKTVIERLADPLTHMIRNAIDHGLETAEQRFATGKPAEGAITLSAQHRSGRVLIEVADDGGGINRARVKEIAQSKGLIPADAQLSDSEIDNLLFLPGFSTAKEVSALSGRGVGMDVVRSAIQALGGRIAIVSEPGKGSTFSISLPLTLAVLDGMVVSVGDQTLVVPLSAIVETATIKADDVQPLGPNNHVLSIRDCFVPIYDLGNELGYRQGRRAYEGAIVLLTAQDDGKRSALVVDAIMEQRQVVIKGLAQSYGHIPGVAAATILGDGQIALILDPTDLVQQKSGHPRPQELAIAG